MNLFLIIFVLFLVLYLIIVQIKYFLIKKETKRLSEKLASNMNEKEAFITDLKKSNGELNIKPIDVLTGLPNRIAFDDRLAQALYQAKRYQVIVGLLSLDIDNFSEVNQFSYEAGDQVLMQVATRLKSCVRQVDSFTRYVGNNYLLLMPQLSQPETAAYVAQRIQEKFLQPFFINGQEFFLTVSMGIAIYPLDSDNVEQLIQHANIALREAKKNGKNNYRFYCQATQMLGERDLIIANYFRESEILNYLTVHYLPQVMTDTGEIIGVQAIPYLNHPELGELKWQIFKKIAENTGKTTEIIEKTLTLMISQVKKWMSLGLKLKWIALSIDPIQLENTHFIFQIIKIIEKSELKDVQLIFEILDTPYQNQENLIEKGISLLKAAGVQFAIEIYALGHSALYRFPSIKLNYFKINAQLIENIITQPSNEKILSAMIDLANSTNISVIAEGINNLRQKAVLRKIGCHIMQGDLFDETILPVPLLNDK